MNQFQGVDYFNIESLLSEDEILVRNTVREFVDDKIIPIIEKHNREGSFPKHLVKEMGAIGLLVQRFLQNMVVQNLIMSLMV